MVCDSSSSLVFFRFGVCDDFNPKKKARATDSWSFDFRWDRTRFIYSFPSNELSASQLAPVRSPSPKIQQIPLTDPNVWFGSIE